MPLTPNNCVAVSPVCCMHALSAIPSCLFWVFSGDPHGQTTRVAANHIKMAEGSPVTTETCEAPNQIKTAYGEAGYHRVSLASSFSHENNR